MVAPRAAPRVGACSCKERQRARLLTQRVLEHEVQVPAQLQVVILVHVGLDGDKRPAAQAARRVPHAARVRHAAQALPADHQQQLQDKDQGEMAGPGWVGVGEHVCTSENTRARQ